MKKQVVCFHPSCKMGKTCNISSLGTQGRVLVLDDLMEEVAMINVDWISSTTNPIIGA